MSLLDQIRDENPSLAYVSDEELIEQLLDDYQGDLSPEQFIRSLTEERQISPVASPTDLTSPATQTGRRPIGTATDPSDVGFGEAFVSGLKSNWQRTWGPGITYLRGGIAGLMGDEERASQLYEQAAQQDADILARTPYISFEQATKGPDAGIDTFVKFGLYQAGMSLPYTLFGGVGGLAGRALLGQAIGKTAATMTGATASFLPTTVQFNLGRQQEQVQLGNLDEVNEATAFAAALPQAVLESALYPVLGRLFGPLSRTRFSQVLDSATLGRVAKGTALSGATEAITEVGQQAIERFQAGLPIDNEDAIREYTEAAAGGAFVGGLFGGATTVAGETARAVQPRPTVEKPVEAPKVEKGVIQDTKVTPEQIDTATEEQVKTEQAKPKNFVVEKQGEKFALKRQDLDTAGNVSSIGTIGTFNTEAEATAEQQKQEDQKNKLTEQTYFTKEAIVKENPTVGNLINELEDVGNTIAPHVQQVYFQKNIALPKGNLSNVKASGGNEFSVVDGWYDRTSDLAAISLIDQSKAVETTAHENFHALQRQINRGYQSGLFLEAEQTALDTFLPGGKVSEIAPSVQRGLGKDVMQRLQERHGENNLSNREMQAYAFGAYTALKAKKKNLAAPNPVIRAFNRLFELVKRAGNVFRKNKINNVNQLFEKARTGEIGKRAKPKEGVEQLRKEALAREDKKELSLTTVKTDKGDIKSIIPNIDPNYGEEIIKTIYNRGITGNRLLKMQVARRRPEQKGEAEDVVLLANNEQQLLSDKEYIIVRDDVTGATARIGDASGRNVSQEYGQAELTRIGKAYARAVERAPGLELAVSTVKFREKPTTKLKKVNQAGPFFDKLVNKSDPLDDAAYNRALDAAEKEIRYQIESQEDDGRGWYDKDIIKKFKILNKKIQVKNQYDKDLFTVITGITSPQSTPVENIERAGRVFSYYKKFGALPLKQPSNTDKFFGRDTISKQLALLQYLIDSKGEKGAVRFLNSIHTKRTMKDIMVKSGEEDYGGVFKLNYGKTAEPSDMLGGLDSEHLGAYMFGNKVGSYFLNISGVADKEGKAVTKDLWATRSFYRQFGMLTDKTQKDGVRADFLSQHIKRGDQFYNDLGKRVGLSAKDAQAVHWFYEHNLYRDLGIRTVRAMYLSEGAQKYIDNFDKGKNYGERELKNRQPSIESQARLRRQKDEERVTKEKTETRQLSVSQRQQIKKQTDDGEIPQFSLSTSEKAFKKILGFKPEMVKGQQMFTNEILAKANNFEEINKFGKYSVRKHPLKRGYTFMLLPSDAIQPEKGLKQFDNIFKTGNYVEIELNIFDKDALDLSAISVPKEGRGQGYASEALGEIIKVADEEGSVITGIIDPFGDKGLSKKKLADWYKRAGFEVDGERITRQPKGQKDLSVSDNLTDVIPKEFSVSDKKIDGKVKLVFFDEPSPDFYDAEVGDVRIMEIDSGEKLKKVKDFGDRTGRFKIGIDVDDKPVGVIQGAITESDTFYVANTSLFDFTLNEPSKVASVNLWRQVAKQMKDRLGVTRYSGLRITGARKKAGVVGKDAFITREVVTDKEMKDADELQFSVSEDLLTDKEISESAGIPDRVKAKLFKNRELKDGERVSVRPNLKGKVEKNENKLFIQTIHPGNNLNKALGYDGAVTVTNPTLFVSQRARANIASKKENKFPMAAARGQYSSKKPKLDGVVLNFNPFNHHLFVDPSGFAVKSIKGDAVMFNTKVYTEGELEYYSREDAPEPLDNIESQVLYKFETEGDKENVGKSELDTLSQEKLIENNLEFAVTDRKYEEATQRVQATVNPKRSRRTIAGFWKQYADNFGVRLQQGLTDQYISVKKFIGEEPYKALTMTYGSSGATESALLYGVPFMDKDGAIDLKANTLGKGLFSRLEKLGPDLTDFLTWVAANRAKAIYDRGMEAGLSSRADVIVAIKDLQKGREKKFNEGLKDLQEFNNAFLDIAVKSGYLDPQSRKAWTEVDGFNFYIPFYRLLDDKASNSGPKAAADIVNQKDYPALRGSDLPVNDLLNNLIQNYAFLTEASLKNAAGLKTLEKGATMGVTRQVKFPTKTSVFVRKNGKKVFYEVDEPLVLQSLTALNWNGWQNPAMGTLRQFKRFLTYGVTASPAFRIRNLIRDSVHSVAVGKLKVNPLGNVLEGFGSLKKDKNKQASELRARLGFGGGSIHFGHIYGADPNASEMLLNRQIDANTIMKSNGWGAGARKLLYKQLGGAARWWEDVGAFSENVNRAALYKQLRDKGVSHFEASYQARDLLNFSRHGANPIVRFLTQSVPFLNARLQGLDKLTRAMGPEQRAQLFAVLGTYSLASIGLYLAYKDDEDFKQREQWDRDTYHWFKIPGTEGVFRIPRPFEVGAIGVIFERMVEQMVDDDVHGALLAERIQHVITETFAFDYRPQLLTPALEVYSNKDSFTGRPVESMAFRRLPATERKYAYTSSAYVNTSKILNTISFDKIRLSPVQIEHLVQGYFGWVGSTVAAAVSFTDYPRQYARFTSTGWDTPLAMGFFKSLPSVQSKYKTQFYDQLQEMNEVFALQRLYESRGEWEKAMNVATEQKNLLVWRKSYNRVNRKIQQINRQIRLIEADKRLSNAEIIDKVRQLNVLKNDMIRALIEQVLEYEKKTGERVKRERWFTL